MNTTKPAPVLPLLPQLLARIPLDAAGHFRMEGEGSGAGQGGASGAPGGGAPAGSGSGGAATTFDQAHVDRIVQERLARERARFADYDELKTKAQKLAELETASQSEQEKAVAKARKDADETARKDEGGKWAQRIISAEVKALAGGKLADPTDAVKMLDLSEFQLDANGDVDAKAVGAAIDKLLETKPYLAAGGAADRRPATNPDLRQGGRSNGSAGQPSGNDWIRQQAQARR